jgi:hypothetical protein
MSASRSSSRITDRPPGHARILGAPRSGKTTLLVERFHHLSRAGHEPLVIAFGREQHDRLLERLLPAGTARFGAMPVTTHGLLASRILSTARPGRARTLRDVDELVVLDRVLERGVLESDLRSIASSSTLRDDLLRLLHVLAQNGVTPDAAEKAAHRAPDPRAADVLRLFVAYQARLRERGLVTFYDASWEAARLVAADPALARAAGVRDVVLVDDMQDLDAGQFALLRAVAPPEGNIALEVFGDPTGPRFSFRGTSDRFLMEEFPALYSAEEFQLAPARPSHSALAATLEPLHPVETSSARAPAGAGVSELPLFATATATATTNERVVATADAWNVNVRAVRAADETAEAQHAARCVREWIDAGIAPDEIVIVARDPERIAALVQHAFRERGVPIDVGARADSAADAFVLALVGALGRDNDGRFAETLAASPLAAPVFAARGLPPDVARAVSTLRKTYSSRGGFDLARLLRETLDALIPAHGIERVAQEWSRYAEVVSHTGGDPSLDEFRHAYLDTPATAGGEKRVPHLVSARAVSGKNVGAAVVLGCADGLFPRVEVDGGYLPLAALADALSRVHPGAASDLNARLDRARAEREESALLYSVLASATNELCVSHPRKSGDQVLTVPAVLAPLFEGAADVERDECAGHRAALRVARSHAGAEVSGSVRELEPMAGGWLAAPPAPRKPVFEKLALSPSRLDTYTSCERKFFFQRVLRIDDPANIYLTIGRVFHDVLKELIPVGASGDEVRAVLASDAAQGIIDNVVAQAMPDTGEWVHTLTKVHMRRMLDGVRELESRREGTYRVLSVETGAWFPDEDSASLTGRLDRIDHVDGLGPVVIDYKTSKSLPKTAASIIDGIENERDFWQVVMYSALARALDHDVKAFVYYVVPPGEDVNAVGVQLASGNLPHVIPGGGRYSRYDPMRNGLLQEVLDDAMAIHASVLAGTSDYARTDNLEHCKNCLFIRVCRRNAE